MKYYERIQKGIGDRRSVGILLKNRFGRRGRRPYPIRKPPLIEESREGLMHVGLLLPSAQAAHGGSVPENLSLNWLKGKAGFL